MKKERERERYNVASSSSSSSQEMEMRAKKLARQYETKGRTCRVVIVPEIGPLLSGGEGKAVKMTQKSEEERRGSLAS